MRIHPNDCSCNPFCYPLKDLFVAINQQSNDIFITDA
jgi:hypothetical protein